MPKESWKCKMKCGRNTWNLGRVCPACLTNPPVFVQDEPVKKPAKRESEEYVSIRVYRDPGV